MCNTWGSEPLALCGISHISCGKHLLNSTVLGRTLCGASPVLESGRSRGRQSEVQANGAVGGMNAQT